MGMFSLWVKLNYTNGCPPHAKNISQNI